MSLWDGFLVEPDHERDEDFDLILRQSTVKSMDLCPARVGYSGTPGYDATPSEAMAFGTLVHLMIEQTLKDPKPWTKGRALEAWVKALSAEGVDLFAIADIEVLEASALEAVSAHLAWYDWWTSRRDKLDTRTMAVEQKLWRPLGQLPNGRAVWLHGTPDVIEVDPNDRFRGVDWKTAASGWKEGRIHFEMQPSAYTWLAAPLIGDGEDRLELDWTYAVYSRASAEWVEHHTHRGPAEVKAWLRHAWMRAKEIDAQAFPFTPVVTVYGKTQRGWWCSAKYCAAWNVCEGKYLADGVDETEQSTPDW